MILSRVTRKALPLELLIEKTQQVSCFGILFDSLFDEFTGMNNRAVILAAESIPDLDQCRGGQLAGEVHRHLPGVGYTGLPTLAGHIGKADIKVICNAFLDLVDGDGFAGLFLKHITEEMLQSLGGERLPAE